jgi:hypothetical protein
MNGQKLLLVMLVVLGFALSPLLAHDVPRPRLLVLTDISSMKPGVAEPDDVRSLIRLMLYANEFEISAASAFQERWNLSRSSDPGIIKLWIYIQDGFDRGHRTCGAAPIAEKRLMTHSWFAGRVGRPPMASKTLIS